MMLLGLDFDNTLVHYDKLFHQLAIEKGLIEECFPINKTLIRDYLRRRGKDDEFTLLQGEVYGLRILEAEPAKGMLSALAELHQRNIPMVLVSHKTRTPYKGPSYDLHQSAWSWLERYNFFNSDGLNWDRKQVFFEESKESKNSRIRKLKCTHYIDDLPEILFNLPDSIQRILYDPEKLHENSGLNSFNCWSSLLTDYSIYFE